MMQSRNKGPANASFRRLTTIVLGCALVALTPLAVQTRATAADPLPLRVAATANDTYAEAYYAQDRGFFAKAGLNVELTTFANGASVAQAVAGGGVDVGISNVVQIASAVEHNIPFKYFAGGGMYASDSATSALLVANDTPIKSAKEFEGKSIAVSTLKDLSALATKAWLAQNGVDVTKVTFIEIPFPAMAPALTRGTVAGAVISEPSLSFAKENGARIFAQTYDAIGKRFMISGWFANAEFLAKNPEAARRFALAIYEAGKWANAHHAESAAILVKYAKMKPELAAKMARCRYAERLDPAQIQGAIDLGVRYGVIDRAIDASELIAAVKS